jgi:hydroxymethylpyrimidine pyrophosphatase-like HAD family hydrolase
MNNNYKLLVTDIDGTIANQNGEISDVDLEAMLGLYHRGIPVSFARDARPADVESTLTSFLLMVSTFFPRVRW